MLRAWDDYVDYAAYLTGERERHRSLEASAESAAAAAAASAAAAVAAAAVGDAGNEAAPAPAVAVAVAAPPRYSGLVQSLLDRKEAAMGPGYVARKRRQKVEEDDSRALDDGDDGESRAVSGAGAGARAASLSFTVEDSDALDGAWETADTGGDDDDGDDGIRPLPSLLDTDDGDAAGGGSPSSGWEGLGIGVDIDGRSGVFDDEFLDKFLRSRGDRNRGGGSGMAATLPGDVDKPAPVLGSAPPSAAVAAAAVDPESRSRAVDAALSQLLRGPLPTTADTDPDTDTDIDTAADT